jgi:signal peptidase I
VADVVRSAAPQEDPDRAPRAHSDSGVSEQTAEIPVGGKAAHRRQRKGSFWRELPLLVVTALVLTFLIQTFLARVYVIPSQSMEQTLNGCPGCTNDRVLVDKVTYRFSTPKPGDVVVFRGPDPWTEGELSAQRSSNVFMRWLQDGAALIGLAQPNEKDFVKRVIAVGGQTVSCCDAQNRVMVNGKPLDEPYVYWDPTRGAPHTQEPFAKVTVPAGYLWMMGDNRNDSFDSRKQGGGGVNGVVPVANAIGKVRFIVLPPSRWQGVGDHNPQAAALGASGWQAGMPVGVGTAAAWPVLWFGRTLRNEVTQRRRRRSRGGGRG